MHRFVIALAAFSILTASAGASDISAIVAKLSGKCQIQQGADWVPLTAGQTVPVGATVSTGFRSELQLKIGPSTVTVKPLSRLKVQDLVATGGEVKTDLYLAVGKINAEVNKDETVQGNKFQVGSPVSTASVRGTVFSFDGLDLRVDRGVVALSDLRGNSITVNLGEAARVVVGGRGLIPNHRLLAQQATVQVNANNEYSDGGNWENWDSYDWDSWDGWSYWDILDYFAYYDWWGEMAATRVTIGGITGGGAPAVVRVTVGGISESVTSNSTHFALGGILP